MGNHDLAALGALGLIETPTSANWDLRYIADYDSWPTFAAYGVPIPADEFRTLAAAVRTIKPYYDPFSALFAGGEVPSRLRQQRDDTVNRVAELLDHLRQRLPRRHQAFLTTLPWCIEHPNYLIVHAGLAPEQAFANQLAVLRARDFTQGRPVWLHEKKLATGPLPAGCSVTVVSGHTLVPEVRILQEGRRMLLDTYDGPGTVLSAVLLPEVKVITG
jgi:serine/threonine protein phosphatase 1